MRRKIQDNEELAELAFALLAFTVTVSAVWAIALIVLSVFDLV